MSFPSLYSLYRGMLLTKTVSGADSHLSYPCIPLLFVMVSINPNQKTIREGHLGHQVQSSEITCMEPIFSTERLWRTFPSPKTKHKIYNRPQIDICYRITPGKITGTVLFSIPAVEQAKLCSKSQMKNQGKLY